jgi:hypothetical protein
MPPRIHAEVGSLRDHRMHTPRYIGTSHIFGANAVLGFCDAFMLNRLATQGEKNG